MSKKKPPSGGWQSKIVGHGKERPDQLLANPWNHRKHPQRQRDVVEASIRELGFIKSVIVNRTTGHMLDGHERTMQALERQQRGEDVWVDVEYVELSEADERKALLILDASSELADIDRDNLAALIEEVQTGEQALADLIASMAEENDIIPGEEPLLEPTGEMYRLMVTVDNVDALAILAERLRADGYTCHPMH